MRLFFALWPPRETAEALHAWALRASGATGGRATRVESIHLTLAFLGDMDERLLPGLKSIRAKAKHHLLPIEQSRYWSHNRIVWAGPHETPRALSSLVENLNQGLEAKGFKPEERPFAAHITLIRKARRPGELPELPKVDWPVREYVLVRSQLSAAGPRYDVLSRYRLGSRR